MSTGVLTAVMTVALGAGPYAYETAGPLPGDYPTQQMPIETYGAAPVGGYGGGSGEPMFPYDAKEQWVHGYIQEIPAYGGFNAFRPYNYKHVLSQSQAAGGWGMSPNTPYSQQFWHRYQEQAAMRRHLSEVGMNEYTAELARIRAKHDFEVQRKIAQEQPRSRFAPPSNGFQQPAPIAATPRTDTIDRAGYENPAGYEQIDRMGALQNRIEQQTQQLRQLQQALERERQAQSQPGRAFYPSAGNR